MLRDETWLPHRGPLEFEVGAVLMPAGAGWAEAIRLRNAARAAMVALSGAFDLAG